MKIAVICSEFNKPITQRLFDGCVNALTEQGIQLGKQDLWWVPGAVELPFVAQCLAKKSQYEAIICLGAVIRGETTHYDYVCESVTYGCQRVSLDFNVPVIFGVLTTENKVQALDRLGGAHGHKGVDAAITALHMARLARDID
jgi:6,7-dimethyl-8-ribityllumazine synthase